MTDTELYTPDPPPNLAATPTDVAALEEFVHRFGWHETLWHIGQLLVKEHGEATGPRQGSIRAVANHVNFIVPGAYWIDNELRIHRPEVSADAD